MELGVRYLISCLVPSRSPFDMEAVWENLWNYSGFASVVLVTAVIGFIPWIATWLDGKLEKLALQEVLAELKSKVCAF